MTTKSVHAPDPNELEFFDYEEDELRLVLRAVSPYLANQQVRYALEGLVSNRLFGIVPEAPDSDGYFTYSGVDDRGRSFVGKVQRYTDSQTASETPTQSDITQLPISSPADLARNENLEVRQRIAGLSEWACESPKDAASFICDELLRTHNDRTWRDSMILAAESVVFDIAEADVVGQRLLELAELLRNETPSPPSSIIFSAIHRGASLIDVERCDLLVPLLSRKGSTDTRLAAIQAIVRILDVDHLLTSSDIKSTLCERVSAIVTKHLDSDVFAPGQVAALAQEGIVALELLEVGRGRSILNERRPDLPRWFNEQTARKLQVLSMLREK